MSTPMPETKITDLTVEQFGALIEDTLMRVADHAAVRFDEERRKPTTLAVDYETRQIVEMVER